MKLTKVIISNYRSINGTAILPMDERVTALLGSNDHGKTNLLEAIRHLNSDRPFEPDDLNWNLDPAIHAAINPRIEYEFQLDNEIVALIRGMLYLGDEIPDHEKHANTLIETIAHSRKAVAFRAGIGNALMIANAPENVGAILSSLIPRVELFAPPPASLPDSVAAEQIATEQFEFMQGIFRLAGLNPTNCQPLFTQGPRTVQQLEDASERLNNALRKQWSQGKDAKLSFKLQHSTKGIELYVTDPTVTSQKVRISRKSTGVTQFFRMSMVLHARQEATRAKTYIYLFDEPGTNLHPQGQRDLLQVFEKFSDQMQIAYATHSIFLLNHNYPERHRLIINRGKGTEIDSKGARANWRYATSAMGVALPPTVYFCDRLLLVEGESDIIYLYELLRQLNQCGNISVDANFLGVLSFNDRPGIRYLSQMLRREDDALYKICLLGDGDKDGSEYAKLFETLSPNHVGFTLESACSTEDYCMFPDQLIEAVIQSTKNLGIEDADDLRQKQERLRIAISKKNPEKTLGKHLTDEMEEIFGDSTSKPTVARLYAEACRNAGSNAGVDPAKLAIAKSFLNRLNGVLSLPKTKADDTILSEKIA